MTQPEAKSSLRLKRLSLLGAFLFAAQTVGFGATYYVDFAGGSDESPGISAAEPWQHCPGDPLATGQPVATGLAAGDRVVFKGGVAYASTVRINGSGTPGNPIVYDGNSLGSFGSGKAILDGEHVDDDSRRYGFRADQARQHLEIRNFEVTRLGGYPNIYWTDSSLPPLSAGYGIELVNCSHVLVDSCYFHEIGAWTNAPHMTAAIMEGIGVSINKSGDSITISNCEFTRLGRGAVRVSADTSATNIVITGCDIHHYVRWGIDIVAARPSCTIRDVRILGNRIRDIWQYRPETWLGLAGTWPHFDGIIMRVANHPQHPNVQLGTPGQPVLISGNTFYNDGTSSSGTGTSMIFLTAFGGRVVVCNNTFVNTLQSYGGIYVQDIAPQNGTTPADYWFVNNTFYDVVSAINLRNVTAGFELTHGTFRIKNNVFYKASTDANFSVRVLDGTSNPTELNYNSYYTARPDGRLVQFTAADGQKTYPTMEDLRSNGWELHGIEADPEFVNTSFGLGAQSSRNDVQLRDTSPCIQEGENLSALFGQDMLGRTRPEVGPWTLGAFSAGVSFDPAPSQPAHLRVMPAP